MRFVARNGTDHIAALVKLVDLDLDLDLDLDVVRVGVEASRPLAEPASVHRDAEAGRLPGKTILLPEESPA
ncbi:hypothetical protein [Planomonospora sp. ID82291]|uniref:hypothetical protein n=1 Tax=Planomonospora sp. ID82291 TaxID=2738136 RepID=UPI0018C35F4A|nr:hypothetical protein [Planomonospora sp. ID82291]MBG0812782.1 hypothetical protein [Planomonospora sp. ID82291]